MSREVSRVIVRGWMRITCLNGHAIHTKMLRSTIVHQYRYLAAELVVYYHHPLMWIHSRALTWLEGHSENVSTGWIRGGWIYSWANWMSIGQRWWNGLWLHRC